MTVRTVTCPICGDPAVATQIHPDGLELVSCPCLADRIGPNRVFICPNVWERVAPRTVQLAHPTDAAEAPQSSHRGQGKAE